MTIDSSIAELLERLEKEIQNPKDSVHKIVLKITIDNINKLLKQEGDQMAKDHWIVFYLGVYNQ